MRCVKDRNRLSSAVPVVVGCSMAASASAGDSSSRDSDDSSDTSDTSGDAFQLHYFASGDPGVCVFFVD